MDIKDINLFYTINKKSENDILNRSREKILGELFSKKPVEFINDIVYGEKWNTLYTQLQQILTDIHPEPYKFVSVESRGGMSYNHDFVAKYIADDDSTEEIHLEFKYNTNKLTALPQFLELYDSDCISKLGLFNTSYGEYYYDNYLNDYVKLCEGDSVEIPDKSVYLKNVKDIKYKHPFFQFLYKKRNQNVDKKNKFFFKNLNFITITIKKQTHLRRKE